MAYNRGVFSTQTAQTAEIDAGLRQYMLRVYNYMTSGLILTGLVAWFVSQASVTVANGQMVMTPLGETLFLSPLRWVVMLAPLAFIFALSFGVQRMKTGTLQILFWLFAAVMGVSLATIFLTFTGESIARVFFITAATFAAMSLYGYTTKRDLTKFGSFLFMGLIGIILASLVNIFIGSSALQFAISVIGVLVFTGLTAWDTQKIKESYVASDGGEIMGKKAIMGALSLYLDFINLFVMLMHLLGERR